MTRQSNLEKDAVPGSDGAFSTLVAPTPVTAAMNEIRTAFPRPGYDTDGNPVSYFSDDNSDEEPTSSKSLRPAPLKSKPSMKNLFKKKTKEQQMNEEYQKKLYSPENTTKEQLLREEETCKARHSQTLHCISTYCSIHPSVSSSSPYRSSSVRGTLDTSRRTPLLHLKEVGEESRRNVH